MPQPDIPHALCSTDEQPPLDAMAQIASPDQAIAQDSAELNPFPVEALDATSATTQDSTTRIRDLEHALDQALACLADFKGQIQNQAFLEAQLIKTEEFASVQHQAIACLKQQLQRSEQSLKVRDQVLLAILGLAQYSLLQELVSGDSLGESPPKVLPTPEAPIQLSLPLDNTAADPTEAQEQLAIAQQQIHRLTQHIVALETELKQAAHFLEERQVLELTLRQTKTLAAERDTAIAALRKELAIAQIKVEELETELAKQHKLQAKWQQTSQELELERDRQGTRIADLERDVHEMQEQILQQARQASEYETAVQHWKDRYLAHQRQMAHMSDLLEQALPNSLTDNDTNIPVTPALIELLALLQWVGSDQTSEPEPLSALPSPRFSKIDLPEFLMRRRNFRTR
ncbi:hypothetical protein H6G89_12340 [Oscillatoria sp. FACHB-1407]|uniref:hypothetical protein n=1 Tax=Oscillatoria sp. FACHB-1407 TaxID=2692847 RepID=UPI0016859F05|nr:hypothetical protein [Oscillatoria sp. FACHB-1407]MBD2461837.1 hypothetical protein [Oscillatoria sp. FACHB-1407]